MAKKRRRSNGQGTIYETKNGKWIAQISIYKDGKIKRPKRTCDKHADAVEVLKDLQSMSGQLDMDEQGHTVASYLMFWLGDEEETELAENTYSSYISTINNHLIPQIGRVKLADLKATKIRQMIANLKKRGVGTRSIEMSYVVLNAALNQAYQDDVIIKNPCISVKKPVHKSEECVPFTEEEREKIFAEAKDDFFYPLYKIILATGIRSSEAFGLHWEHVDFKRRTISIKQQCSRRKVKELKTKYSQRTLDITDGIEEMFRLQKKQLKNNGFHKNKHVFCGDRGAYLDGSTFGRRHWTPLLVRAGVESRGMHHLRHTFATELLGNNVAVHVVSRLLGHSSPTVTYDIYAHMLPSQQSQAAEVIQRIFG